MNKKSFFLIPLVLFVFALSSCKKEIPSEKGSIDIFTNIYYNASRGLNNYKQFYISRMDYRNDTILEFIPNIDYPAIMDRVVYIKKDSFYNVVPYEEINNLSFSQLSKGKAQSVYNKNFGSKWVNFPITNYDKRIEMNDTILYGNKEYKRFKTIENRVLTIFYIKKTDTIVPYSLNPIADKDYKGRLERIDSYDKKNDIFVTLVLKSNSSLSDDANKLFNLAKMTDVFKQIKEKK